MYFNFFLFLFFNSQLVFIPLILMRRARAFATTRRGAMVRPVQSTAGSLPDEILDNIFVRFVHGFQTGDTVWVQCRCINECTSVLVASTLVCRVWYSPASRALYTNPRPVGGSSCVALLRTLRRRIDLRRRIHFVHLPVAIIEQRLPPFFATLRRSLLFPRDRQAAAEGAAAAWLASYPTFPNRKALIVQLDVLHRPSQHTFPWINKHVAPNLEYMQVEAAQPRMIYGHAWWWTLWASLPDKDHHAGLLRHIQRPQVVFTHLQTLHIKGVNLSEYYNDDLVATSRAHLGSVLPALRELILESLSIRAVAIFAFLEATRQTMRSLTMLNVRTRWVDLNGHASYQEGLFSLIGALMWNWANPQSTPVFQQLEELRVGVCQNHRNVAGRLFQLVPLSRFSRMRYLGINAEILIYVQEIPELLEKLTIYFIPLDTGRDALLTHVARLKRRAPAWKAQSPGFSLMRLQASSCPTQDAGNWQLVRYMLPLFFQHLGLEVRIDVRY